MKIMFRHLRFSYLIMAVCFTYSAHGQPAPELLEIDGAVKIADSAGNEPKAGTIRWTGADFEGWNGFTWVPLGRFALAGTITDHDNNEYGTVQIGTQIWMSQNLRVTQDQGKNLLTNISDDQDWTNGLMTAKYCWYMNQEETFKVPYGALYDHKTATGQNSSNEICPVGWRLPNNTDWTLLQVTLGGLSAAGGPLKEQGESHWTSPNIGATNSSGFTAVGGGWRTVSGAFGFQGENSYFWSETTDAGGTPFIWTISANGTVLSNNVINANFGVSVRCIKN